MTYIWSPSLETGFEKFDEQHKQLFNTLNSIANASMEEKGAEELQKTLNFLTEFTAIHFSMEEDFMIQHNYPAYKAHKRYHEDFKVTIGNLIQQFHDEGPSKDLLLSVTVTIGDWLTCHIRVDDIQMAMYIKHNEL